MKSFTIIFVATLLSTTAAFAQGNNGGGNGGCGVGQNTNGCGTSAGGGAGGAGGAGGSAIQGQAQGQIQAQGQVQGQTQSSRNDNKNTNTNINGNSNSNRNTNKNTANGGAGGSSAATSGSTSRGGEQSQEQGVDNRGVGSNSNNYQQSGIPVSSATAPSFAIGSCQWAFSGGAQFFGFGASAGSAGMYEFCKSLMKAQHFRTDGNRNTNVAKALECQDSSIRAAYKMAGEPCQEDLPRQTASATPTPAPVPVPVSSTLPSNCVVVQPGNYVTCQ